MGVGGRFEGGREGKKKEVCEKKGLHVSRKCRVILLYGRRQVYVLVLF